ncbi:MAG: beta-N-acetylglucosaminidase domain-containing protein [Acidobacteriaceae bacterium]
MYLKIKKYRAMRDMFPWVLFAFCGLLPAVAARQPDPLWRIVSARTIGGSIQRQFQQLALEQHACIRFSHQNRNNGALNSRSTLFLLDTPTDRQMFVDELRKETGASVNVDNAELLEEGYILHIDYTAPAVPGRIRIEAASARGFHLALLRVPELLSTPALTLETEMIPRPQSLRILGHGSPVIIADFPRFPIRGIVEGFYGQPWSHSDRLDVLRFEGRVGMNFYLYGPKDDPYNRELWREPYPARQQKQIAELATVARENFVNFSFAISPGLSMTYSSDADFQTLARKLRGVHALGVTNFALLLDDVPQYLTHPEDKLRFHSLAQAHIQLINHLYEFLHSVSPDIRLVVCPTTYTNEWGSRDYIRELGAGVRPEVPLMWTGTEVIPATITVEQAKQWGVWLHRKPLVWDNYPTNDGNTSMLNLDPLRGRAPQLFTVTSGLVSNPMNQAHASMIPLQTISDYLWNPVAYDPQASQRHAIVSQYGSAGPATLAPLLDIFRADSRSRLAFRSLFEETWAPIDVPAIEVQILRLRSLRTSLQTQPRYQKLLVELNPIPDTLQQQLDLLRKSSAFTHLPDGKIQWDRTKDILDAARMKTKPAFDGDFSKWESKRLYRLNTKSQIVDGEELWQGPSQFSARIALAWDQENLYIGVDVTDPNLYQPFTGRAIQNGDAFRLTLNTAQPLAAASGRIPTVFDLYLSPGDFSQVKPDIYSDEDLFPVRPQIHDYNREIHAIWKKTATGFSGDVVVPVSFFERQNFSAGQQIGLSFGVQKAFPQKDPSADNADRILFSSKGDSLFPVYQENPETLQQMVLRGESGATRASF